MEQTKMNWRIDPIQGRADYPVIPLADLTP